MKATPSSNNNLFNSSKTETNVDFQRNKDYSDDINISKNLLKTMKFIMNGYTLNRMIMKKGSLMKIKKVDRVIARASNELYEHDME